MTSLMRASRRSVSTSVRMRCAETPAGVAYTKLTIGVPKESFKGERRVAITPAATQILTKKVRFFEFYSST